MTRIKQVGYLSAIAHKQQFTWKICWREREGTDGVLRSQRGWIGCRMNVRGVLPYYGLLFCVCQTSAKFTQPTDVKAERRRVGKNMLFLFDTTLLSSLVVKSSFYFIETCLNCRSTWKIPEVRQSTKHFLSLFAWESLERFQITISWQNLGNMS